MNQPSTVPLTVLLLPTEGNMTGETIEAIGNDLIEEYYSSRPDKVCQECLCRMYGYIRYKGRRLCDKCVYKAMNTPDAHEEQEPTDTTTYLTEK